MSYLYVGWRRRISSHYSYGVAHSFSFRLSSAFPVLDHLSTP